MKLRLATRGSKLAWSQSGQVADLLRAMGHEIEMVHITTHGDVTTAPLASLGGAGVFVGAVRAAVLSGEADFAVHSFKDLPTAAEPGLTLAAVPPREDPADALCTADGRTLDELPAGARIGTGSPRRAAQLRAIRPDLEIVEIRGNVETRLARAGSDLDAVVLAAAGLRRIGLGDRVTQRFQPDEFLPAPAQGALALECRVDAVEVLAALAALDDPATRVCAVAERAVLAGLQAGCAAPVGAYARVIDDQLHLTAAVVAVDGLAQITEQGHASEASEPSASGLGSAVARRLLAAGAAAIVDLAATKPRPLAGRQLLLPSRCPSGLVELLTSAGAEVNQTEFTTQEAIPTAELQAAAGDGYDWLVITSAATVNSLASQGYDLAHHHPATAKVAAVGPSTAAALTKAGLKPDLVAHPGGGAALAASFGDGPGVVLLPGAETSSTEPAAGLTAKGWTVHTVPVYRTVSVEIPAAIQLTWPSYDALVVTAGSVAKAAGALGLPGPKVVAIGQPAAVASRRAGFEVAQVAATPDANGLLNALLAALS